jgi:hypothetical protein
MVLLRRRAHDLEASQWCPVVKWMHIFQRRSLMIDPSFHGLSEQSQADLSLSRDLHEVSKNYIGLKCVVAAYPGCCTCVKSRSTITFKRGR